MSLACALYKVFVLFVSLLVAYLLVFGITCKQILSNNNVVQGFINDNYCLKYRLYNMKHLNYFINKRSNIFRRHDVQVQ